MDVSCGTTWRTDLPRAIAPVLCLAVLALTACVSSEDRRLLIRGATAFIEDGQTLRQDLVLAFGPPKYAFDNDRTQVFVLTVNSDGEVVPSDAVTDWRNEPMGNHWPDDAVFVVAVFDHRGVVQRHSTLEME